MGKKRIAFFVNGLYGGGAEKVFQVLITNIDLDNYDVTVINHREEVVNYLYPTGIKYKSILKSKSRLGNLWVKIYNKINLIVYENFSPRLFRYIYLRKSYDIEIAFIEGYATRIVSGGNASKKIAWIHIDLSQNPWTDIAFRSKREQENCYKLFDNIVSVSQSVKKTVDNLFQGIKKSIVIYNPIDSEEICRMSKEFIPKRNDDTPLLVTAGRLAHQKGYDRLIPLVGKLIKDGYKFELWIIGDGAERSNIEILINQWELNDIVKLLGFQSNPYPYISVADWFVCSSRTEGYSTVVTESLIIGVPVLTTLCPGMEELLGKNSDYGIIVENNDRALLDGLRSILADKSLKKLYDRKAKERSSHFSLKSQMKDIYKIIEE